MKFACKCEKCGSIFMQEEEDIFLMFDFYESSISFICRNKNCKYENRLDFRNWKKRQSSSPLPPTIMM